MRIPLRVVIGVILVVAARFNCASGEDSNVTDGLLQDYGNNTWCEPENDTVVACLAVECGDNCTDFNTTLAVPLDCSAQMDYFCNLLDCCSNCTAEIEQLRNCTLDSMNLTICDASCLEEDDNSTFCNLETDNATMCFERECFDNNCTSFGVIPLNTLDCNDQAGYFCDLLGCCSNCTIEIEELRSCTLETLNVSDCDTDCVKDYSNTTWCDLENDVFTTCFDRECAGSCDSLGVALVLPDDLACNVQVGYFCNLLNCCSNCTIDIEEFRNCTLEYTNLTDCDTDCVPTDDGGSIPEDVQQACESETLGLKFCLAGYGDCCSECLPPDVDTSGLDCNTNEQEWCDHFLEACSDCADCYFYAVDFCYCQVNEYCNGGNNGSGAIRAHSLFLVTVLCFFFVPVMA